MSLIERLDACARFTPENYRPLMVAGKMLGRVDHAFAETLSAFDDVFDVTADAVTLADNLTDPAARTEAVGAVEDALGAGDDALHPDTVIQQWRWAGASLGNVCGAAQSHHTVEHSWS